jgi:hypothetical protein
MDDVAMRLREARSVSDRFAHSAPRFSKYNENCGVRSKLHKKLNAERRWKRACLEAASVRTRRTAAGRESRQAQNCPTRLLNGIALPAQGAIPSNSLAQRARRRPFAFSLRPNGPTVRLNLSGSHFRRSRTNPENCAGIAASKSMNATCGIKIERTVGPLGLSMLGPR